MSADDLNQPYSEGWTPQMFLESFLDILEDRLERLEHGNKPEVERPISGWKPEDLQPGITAYRADWAIKRLDRLIDARERQG